MYMDFEVDIPKVSGKITERVKKDTTYIYYEYKRTYDPDKQYTNVKRAVIGKKAFGGSTQMIPNENFLKYFPDAELPVLESGQINHLRLRTIFWTKELLIDACILTD